MIEALSFFNTKERKLAYAGNFYLFEEDDYPGFKAYDNRHKEARQASPFVYKKKFRESTSFTRVHGTFFN